MLVFLIKAAAVGLLGGLAGVSAGLLIGRMLGSTQSGATSWNELFAADNLPVMVLIAPLSALVLSGLASWIPALLAARQDPAVILQRE